MCDCGASKLTSGKLLRSGKAKSCGCLARSLVRTPGERRSRRSWEHMLARCYDSRTSKYARYGGRGIAVCDRWRDSFPQFLSDMGERPSGMTLGRIDNDGDYSPRNCRWETVAQQAANTSRTRWVTFTGKRERLVVVSSRFGISPSVVHGRLNMGWSEEKSFMTPVMRRDIEALDITSPVTAVSDPMKRDAWVTVLLSKDEKDRVRVASGSARLTLSAWARNVLLDAARDLEKGSR